MLVSLCFYIYAVKNMIFRMFLIKRKQINNKTQRIIMAQAPPNNGFSQLTAPILNPASINNNQALPSGFSTVNYTSGTARLAAAAGKAKAPISITTATQGAPTKANLNNGNVGDSQDYNTRQSAIGSAARTYKVSLVGNLQSNRYTKLFSGNTINSNIPSSQDYVTFDVMPNLRESGSVNLLNISDVRSIASFVFWTGTASRIFSINAKLVSRTQAEADANYQRLFKIKSWRMPVSEVKLGAGTTPEVLMLFAYGQNINGVPVAVQSVSVDYNDEADQILTSSNNPMPIVLGVSIELVEVRNLRDFRSFNYDEFRQGILPRW
jgi:hypothetical protein